ncbi:hypothetical protein [Streptomyces sp. NBC_00459]|uniref:hypothetical protein n=1 Tax=Streptomyces sp. NBC_00459 TaxID=2975749 RepID=UPI002E19F155
MTPGSPFYAAARHRYFDVHALGVPSLTDLGISEGSTSAALNFSFLGHTLARAVVTPWGGDA